MSSPAVDPAVVGDRVEQLLEASAVAGPVARERAEELVRLVVDLYGAGLERLLDLVHEAGALDDRLVATLAADELVSALLLVHDLHPYALSDRVALAVERVRPGVEAQGAACELLETSADVVRVRLLGAGSGCGSAGPALTALVEDAVRAAAPEVARVEVVQQDDALIPVSSLTARLRAPAVT